MFIIGNAQTGNVIDKENGVKMNHKKRLKLFLKGWSCSLAIAIVLATSFKSAIADWNMVPTGSMLPTIVEGDRIFINKLAYDLKIPYTTYHLAKWGDPKRGDIVVFYSPVDGTRLVKRVVGLPGDTASMSNNQLIIKGRKIRYEPICNTGMKNYFEHIGESQYGFVEHLNTTDHPIIVTPHYQARRTFTSLTIPEGRYFMMGDNRDNSGDSRYFGFVDRDSIVGRALSVVISHDINNGYRPRWERFFTGLK